MLKAFIVVVGLTALSVLTTDGQQPPGTQVPGARLPDGQMMTMPSISSRVMPTLTALTAATAGSVDIETVVSATGSVAHARVAKSSDPSGALDRSCVDALQQWRFTPAASNGQPLASLVLVRFSVAQPAGVPTPVVDAIVTCF